MGGREIERGLETVNVGGSPGLPLPFAPLSG
jgi:hypothetical protein